MTLAKRSCLCCLIAEELSFQTLAYYTKVLSIFRKLHRAKKVVFQGDKHAQQIAGQAINTEFRKHIEVTDPDKIQELIKVAEDAEITLRKNVVQAKLTDKGTYAVKITKDTEMHDNNPYYNPIPNFKSPGRRKRKEKDKKTEDLPD